MKRYIIMILFASIGILINAQANKSSGNTQDDKKGNQDIKYTEGASGVRRSIHYKFSTIRSDSDPGNGIFRFNNDTISKVRWMYVDNNDLSGDDQSKWFSTWEKTTGATARGSISVVEYEGKNVIDFDFTGVFEDGTGYWKLPVKYISGKMPANGVTYYYIFNRIDHNKEQSDKENQSDKPDKENDVTQAVPQPQPVQEPQPVVQEPQPVVQEPQPVVQEPQPVVQEPQPVVQEPQPVVQEPQPVVQEPQPVVQVSQPVVQEPQPVVQEPQPVVQVSQPVVQVSQPVVQEPQPVVQVSQPVVQVSQPVVQEPQPVVQVSQPVVQEPQPVVQEPQPVVHEPLPVVQETQPVQMTQVIKEKRPVQEPQPVTEPQPVHMTQVIQEQQPVKETEPTRTTKPTQTTQPDKPPRTTQTTQTTQPKQTTQPAPPAPPAPAKQTTQTSQPAQVTPARQTTQTTQANQTPQPVQSTPPRQTTQTYQNTQPSQPAPATQRSQIASASQPVVVQNIFETTEVYHRKCYSGIIEIGYALGIGDYSFNNFRINFINGIKIGEYSSIGLGLGFRKYYEEYGNNPESYLASSNTQVPVFLDLRTTFSTRKITPYFALGIGSSTGYTISGSSKEGLFFSPSGGIWFNLSDRFAVFGGIAYELQKLKFIKISDSSYFNKNASSISLNIGISF